MKSGDKVYVTYGGGAFGYTRVYRGKLLVQFPDGRWLVRELWHTSKRLVSEHRITVIGR